MLLNDAQDEIYKTILILSNYKRMSSTICVFFFNIKSLNKLTKTLNHKKYSISSVIFSIQNQSVIPKNKIFFLGTLILVCLFIAFMVVCYGFVQDQEKNSSVESLKFLGCFNGRGSKRVTMSAKQAWPSINCSLFKKSNNSIKPVTI